MSRRSGSGCVTLRRLEVYTRLVIRIVTFAIAISCLAGDAPGQTSPFGDGAIAGVVRDADGSVLPGVVVEASSATLIEGVRADVTDPTGRYEIRGLRPGLYAVTFTLEAYQTVKRERILIEGSVMRTVDQSMVLGSLADSVIVIADTPLIDVRNTTRQAVYSHALLDSMASARNAHALSVL